MNNPEAYQSWLEKKRSVGVSDGFARGVMKQISIQGPPRWAVKPGLAKGQRWLEWVTHHPLIKAALLVVALLVGAVRLLLTWQLLLSF